jgi:hypothetical protein
VGASRNYRPRNSGNSVIRLPVMVWAADSVNLCFFVTEPLRSAHFVERTNCFCVTFRDGQEAGPAYLANSGRLEEIPLPGAENSSMCNRVARELLKRKLTQAADLTSSQYRRSPCPSRKSILLIPILCSSRKTSHSHWFYLDRQPQALSGD